MSKQGILLAVVLAAVGFGFSWLLGGRAPVVERSDRPTPIGAQPTAATRRAQAGPQRIVCAAPSVTELVFAMGQGHRIVGVTDFCAYPPEGVKEKARIGGLYTPNLERILKLQPDLIISVGNFDHLTAFAGRNGIACRSLEMSTLAEIRAAIRALGEALACPNEAREALRRFDADLDAVRARVGARPPARVYLCTSHQPGDLTRLATCGSATFLAELLAIAGGENVFADAEGSWPQISKEALVKRAPDVIVEIQSRDMGVEAARFDRLRDDWRSLPDLPAVRDGRIHFMTDDFLFIPSVRAPQSARRMAEAIHPEAFRE